MIDDELRHEMFVPVYICVFAITLHQGLTPETVNYFSFREILITMWKY